MMGRRTCTNKGVTITCADPNLPADLERLAALAQSVCKRFGKPSAQVSIAIVDDAETTRINTQFLGHAHTTDVISFDLSEETDMSFELVVNADEALRQSSRRSHSLEAELALYITHGLLHQLGYDDTQPGDAEQMHAAEDAILEETGFGKVYARPARGTGSAQRGPEETAQ